MRALWMAKLVGTGGLPAISDVTIYLARLKQERVLPLLRGQAVRTRRAVRTRLAVLTRLSNCVWDPSDFSTLRGSELSPFRVAFGRAFGELLQFIS